MLLGPAHKECLIQLKSRKAHLFGNQSKYYPYPTKSHPAQDKLQPAGNLLCYRLYYGLMKAIQIHPNNTKNLIQFHVVFGHCV